MYEKHRWIEFGIYVQVHEKHNNLMEPRTSGTVALIPSGNEQGGTLFSQPTHWKKNFEK